MCPNQMRSNFSGTIDVRLFNIRWKLVKKTDNAIWVYVMYVINVECNPKEHMVTWGDRKRF